ncbi:hypothetical protein AALP_AA2G013800 [Arabis alpina]|uniref:Uncharacterized protein n=1 Tax=Arabis alpina TaxID=50452 RepID=A0A087HEM0_ARAAL|nr:hypothetical protein AALP_AA2G013800 [Arabis alpina]
MNVSAGHVAHAGESLMQSKVKAIRDFPYSTSNHPKTETSSIEEFDYSSDVATEESMLESNGENEDILNQGLGSPCSTNVRTTSWGMKSRLSLHYSTKEVERDVVDPSLRVIVSGLAAKSKCPWIQPKPKNRGSRQEKRRWFL